MNRRLFTDPIPAAASAGGSPQIVVLNGTATATPPTPTPQASYDPAAVSFGDQTVNVASGARTITVTNVGGFGVETGTPIINKPECAILATGLIAPRPWVVDGRLAVRQLMTASVSFDHRIVDGAYAARFLAHLRDLLEDPALLSAF